MYDNMVNTAEQKSRAVRPYKNDSNPWFTANYLPPWHLPCSAQLRQLQPHEDFPADLSFFIRKIISTITAARIINVITVPILFVNHVMRKSSFFSRFFKLEFIILYFRIICKGSLRRPCKNLLIFQSV